MLAKLPHDVLHEIFNFISQDSRELGRQVRLVSKYFNTQYKALITKKNAAINPTTSNIARTIELILGQDIAKAFLAKYNTDYHTLFNFFTKKCQQLSNFSLLRQLSLSIIIDRHVFDIEKLTVSIKEITKCKEYLESLNLFSKKEVSSRAEALFAVTYCHIYQDDLYCGNIFLRSFSTLAIQSVDCFNNKIFITENFRWHCLNSRLRNRELLDNNLTLLFQRLNDEKKIEFVNQSFDKDDINDVHIGLLYCLFKTTCLIEAITHTIINKTGITERIIETFTNILEEVIHDEMELCDDDQKSYYYECLVQIKDLIIKEQNAKIKELEAKLKISENTDKKRKRTDEDQQNDLDLPDNKRFITGP